MDVSQSNVAIALLVPFYQKSNESISYCTDLCNFSIHLRSLALKNSLNMGSFLPIRTVEGMCGLCVGKTRRLNVRLTLENDFIHVSTLSCFQNVAKNFLRGHSYSTCWLKKIGIRHITGMIVNVLFDTKFILKIQVG